MTECIKRKKEREIEREILMFDIGKIWSFFLFGRTNSFLINLANIIILLSEGIYCSSGFGEYVSGVR